MKRFLRTFVAALLATSCVQPRTVVTLTPAELDELIRRRVEVDTGDSVPEAPEKGAPGSASVPEEVRALQRRSAAIRERIREVESLLAVPAQPAEADRDSEQTPVEATGDTGADKANRDWRVGASSGAFFAQSNDVRADLSKFEAELAVGRMVRSHWLLEAVITGATEAEGRTETDSSRYSALVGVRYYWRDGAATRPFVGVRGGLTRVDVDQGGGVSDADVSPIAAMLIGLESWLTPQVSVELGVAGGRTFDEELFGSADNANLFNAFIGLGVWL